MTPNRKLCIKCLKQRPLNQFAKGRGSCRKCCLQYFKTYNAKRYSSPEARTLELERGRKKYRDSIRPARIERKRRLLLLMGGRCSVCGYNKSAAALDFHHLSNHQVCRGQPNKDKARTISHLLANGSKGAFELTVKEVKHCRILCANCHRENTFPGHELNPQIKK